MAVELEAYEGRRPFVFVSYSHKDKEVVFETIRLLQEHKYRVWFDNGIHSGTSWTQTIDRRIDECTTFVLFLSPNSTSNHNIAAEVTKLFDEKREKEYKFVPIWITKSGSKGQLDYFLRATQIAFNNGTEDHNPEELFKELNVAIPDSCRDSVTIEKGILADTEDDIHDLITDESIVGIGDYACKARRKLTQVVIGKNVDFIGDEAFRGCSALTEIFIPDNVRKIGDSAFRDCTALEKLVIEGNIEIGERAFENCGSLVDVTLPDELTEIYNGVFNSCKKLKRITLPKELIAIGDSAFSSCVSLQKVVIPKTVTRIDDMVFNDCQSLTEVVLPEGVSRIGKNVFKDCVSLESITIPASVRKMDAGCFRGCSSLKEIIVNNKNKYFKSMNGIMFNKNKSNLLCYPTCMPAKCYEVPDSVRVIEDWAFSDSKYLTSVVLPDSVEVIGEGAFNRCLKLKSITIPYSVDTIQDTVFRGCTELKNVYIESDSFKDIGWGIFYGCDDVHVYCVSKQLKERFKGLNVKATLYHPKD